MDAEELRRARDEATTREHMQRKLEEDERARAQKTYASRFEEIKAGIDLLKQKAKERTPEQEFREKQAEEVKRQAEKKPTGYGRPKAGGGCGGIKGQWHREREAPLLGGLGRCGQPPCRSLYHYDGGCGRGVQKVQRAAAQAYDGHGEGGRPREEAHHRAYEEDRRRRLHGVTSQRMVGISDGITGKFGSEAAKSYEKNAAMWGEAGKKMREERAELLLAQKEKDKQEKAAWSGPEWDKVMKAARGDEDMKTKYRRDESPADRQAADIKRQQTEEANSGSQQSSWKAPTQEERAKGNTSKKEFSSAAKDTSKTDHSGGWKAPSRPDSGNNGGGQTRQGGTRGR